MIRVIANQFNVTIIAGIATYQFSYDNIDSFEAFATLLNDLGFGTDYMVLL